MSDRLSIQNEMRAFDHKDREFYDSLTEDELKKFSTFLMMKYGANVSGSSDLQEWYLRAHNERVNTNFYDISRHPKLQWLLCTTVSPGMGSQRHYWLKAKKDQTDNRSRKFLAEQFPHYSDQEIDLLATINSREQLQEYARSLGWDEQDIKKQL
jgi:hypothetical protein